MQDVQEYFLLGAMAYLGMRRYKDALLYLEHVLSTPTRTAPARQAVPNLRVRRTRMADALLRLGLHALGDTESAA